MARSRVYKSEQQALFEAWLQDGIYYRQNGAYTVLSKSEARNQLSELIEKKEFSLVKGIAEQLKSSVVLSDKSIPKSLRVPFVSYATLVESALRQRTSISMLVRNMMVNVLEKFLADATERNDIMSERLNLLQNAFETWQKESLGVDQNPKDSYSPSMLYYPHMSKDLFKMALEKAIAQIWEKSSKIPSEVLEKYLNVDWEESVEEVQSAWPDMLDQSMHLDKNSKLVLDIIFSPFAILDLNLEEYEALNREVRTQYGSEVVQTLNDVLEIDAGFFDDSTEKLPLFFQLNLLSIPLAITQGSLRINDVVVDDKHGNDEIRHPYIENRDKQSARLRSRLNEAVKQEDWDKVSAVSDSLARVERDYRLQEYGLQIALSLLRKTQVITVRAPEILVHAWEACGGFERMRGKV